MYYLISNETIIQIEEQPFEVHEDLTWIEADQALDGYKAVYNDGQIVFEQVQEAPANSLKMTSKASRDVVFCIGEMQANASFVNPNLEGGQYNQSVFLINGSGDATDTTTETKVTIDNTGNFHDIKLFKNLPIRYSSYENGAKWIAVNPLKNEDLDLSYIKGSNNQTITDNANGITILNAKGTVKVNGTNLELNDPVFYHPNTELQINVSRNSYAIIVRYTNGV